MFRTEDETNSNHLLSSVDEIKLSENFRHLLKLKLLKVLLKCLVWGLTAEDDEDCNFRPRRRRHPVQLYLEVYVASTTQPTGRCFSVSSEEDGRIGEMEMFMEVA